MLTEKQGYTIAKETGLNYEPGWDYTRGQEDTSMHVFRTGKMDGRSCWIDHIFYSADSAQECLERKQKTLLPEEMQGDPDCEICHGAGCPNCNDTMYYEQEAVVEQYRRDQVVDKARLLHPDEVGW